MADKPSDTEEEYFRKIEAQKKKELAEEVATKEAAESAKALKELHFMHCPKCGNELETLSFKGVDIDKCGVCHGVWLDDGELEKLAGKEGNVLQNFLGMFRSKD